MATDEVRIDDDLVQKKWLELAPLIDRMVERTSSRGEFPVAEASSLRGDDNAADPYHVSHVLRMCLNAGVDHLHAIKALIIDQQVLHVAAPASLARGALENFASAYWVLSPQSRDERIKRTLRWHAKNIKDADKAVAKLGLPNYKPRDVRLSKLYAVGAKRNIDPRLIRDGYTSTEAVQYADMHAAGLRVGEILLPWQICSGFAHGRPWAYLGVSKTEKQQGDEPGIVNLRLTNDLSMALYPTLAATRLLEEFLRLYNQRAGSRLA